MDTEQTPPTIAAALAQAAARLPLGAAANSEAQLLLGHVLACTRSALLVREDERLTSASLAAFTDAVGRRARGEPLAYITGHKEFWSLELKVTPDVLVPRPETELVVERALALLGAGRAAIADLGTGSGAIALALARERPGWQVTATDLSGAALAVAQANAAAIGVANVRLRRGDWFSALAGECFDLLASNPPYIASGDAALADPALRHEPMGALASGPTGLEALATLVEGAPAHLRARGWLVLEHGAGQAGAVAELLVARGYRHVRCHADLAGLARVTEAQRPAH
ncbi:MAG: peptide chain release factor N(5)-glutamine methyltransferase [Gammaproteobacteria bacterium]|nr:peptide chain release factor N(5)-glutamine methyltransferase [Gammaproteobacteria bacterium]